MEKFSTWRDKATGISPFMPLKQPPQPWFTKLAKLIIFILRLPFFLLSVLIYSILPLNAINRFIILVLFGLKDLQVLVDGVKRSSAIGISMNLPKAGDVVFANYISPLDGFIFNLVSQAKIVILIPDASGKLYRYTPWSLFQYTFSLQHKGQPIDNIQQFKNSAVFVLLEGTSTNNKGLLPFIKLSNYDFAGFSIKSMVMKINPGYYTLPIPYISKYWYLYMLLTNVQLANHYIKIKIYLYQKFDSSQIRNSFEINQINPVNLSIEDKAKFLTYYNDFKVKRE